MFGGIFFGEVTFAGISQSIVPTTQNITGQSWIGVVVVSPAPIVEIGGKSYISNRQMLISVRMLPCRSCISRSLG